ncbi:MAG: hypothetical protein ACREGD_05265, partial [Candidatus Saccharimonadales bacterium]
YFLSGADHDLNNVYHLLVCDRTAVSDPYRSLGSVTARLARVPRWSAAIEADRAEAVVRHFVREKWQLGLASVRHLWLQAHGYA